ncbi:50S ribosomal protein L11 methyltransferase [Streptomyces sp. KLOTTS4A1]|uniref:DUF7059 domain-containing protein n=1 Tax=Streptomyces sp. KLOTTS4A1 TaxID=3390996 RepID=UPI0039F45203
MTTYQAPPSRPRADTTAAAAVPGSPSALPPVTAEHHRAGLAALAGLLRRCGFDAPRAARLLRARDPEHLLSNPARYAFFGDRDRPAPDIAPTAVLTSLFLLNRPVPADWVRRALPAELTGLLRELALVERADDDLRATLSLTPYRSRYFLSDQLFTNPAPQQVVARSVAELVMPPHASSLLALQGVDHLTGSLLDAGCGSGFLALSRRTDGPAAGFDLNPRAVAFSRANAALNGSAARFETAGLAADASGPGSLLAEGRYDHLVFNSPTVPRIDGDAGEFGQSTARHALTLTADTAGHLLRPGGTAHVLTVIEVPESRSAEDVVRGWLGDSGPADVTVRELSTPYLSVTPRQLREGRLGGQNLFAEGPAHARRLLAALTARGTHAVVPVLVTLGLPAERN